MRTASAALLLAAGMAATATDFAPHARRSPEGQAEPIAIVVNRANPVSDISLAELRRLLLGERSRWRNGRRVTIVMREPGTAERSAILRQVLGMSESAFRRHFVQAVFIGDVSDSPRELASSNGVLRFVFNVPGAIGYVRTADADSTVKVVRVDGLAPDDPGYPLLFSGP